uniref:Uncharacterized protein AlNc14C34G3083 n=1 Tax=Albugo laibachii Nc14 TaxID=890382 RepID=F0W8F3_9STRA|nr:hypothetical protein BRAFLDRAFT_126732 [Albugo laibachii Nc14]|eukprot:CCA17408.1 hypothetical protein BRAFLDRAFT_126732 [Albugo laibachii Nc14]
MPIVTGATIRGKGAKIQEELLSHASPITVALLSSLSFSTGWICRFQKRHKLTSKRVRGEAASTNSISVKEAKALLLAITQGFAKRDIYNMDEAAFFYCMPPHKTVSTRQPRCFYGKTGDQLSFDYASTAKGWMNTVLFQRWARRFNDGMRAGNRHVLLLLENASSHRLSEPLTQVTLKMLPPNTNAYLQPQDAGIIQSFKTQVERLKTRYVGDKFDKILNRAADMGKENIERY